MTVGDKIRQFNDDKLAQYIAELHFADKPDDSFEDCIRNWRKILEDDCELYSNTGEN